MFSSPPRHGAAIVVEILSNPQLYAEWRVRIPGAVLMHPESFFLFVALCFILFYAGHLLLCVSPRRGCTPDCLVDGSLCFISFRRSCF